MQGKNAKQAKRRSAGRMKLRIRVRSRPVISRGLDLGDVRLQFLLGATALPR